jgi:hypothetical protein
MKKSLHINSPVDVTAMGFGRNMRAYPRRMEFQGIAYDFIDAGLRTIVRDGERITQMFTMTDGTNDYYLRAQGSSWTLLGMTQ